MTVRPYRQKTFPSIVDEDSLRKYVSDELRRIEQTLTTIREVCDLVDTTDGLIDAANDAAAEAAGVPVNGLYRSTNAVQIRLT